MKRARNLGCFLAVTSMLFAAGCGGGSDPNAPPKVDAKYIPDGAFAAFVAHPSRAMNSKTLEPLKLKEFLADAPTDELPFDPQNLNRVVVVVAMGSGGGEPEEPSTIYTLNNPQDKQTILAKELFEDLKEFQHNGKSFYARNEEEWSDCWSFPDDKTILFAESPAAMKAMLSGSGSGALVDALAETDTNHDAYAVVTMAPVRSMLTQQLARAGDGMPPQLKKVPDQIQTITATADLDPTPKIDIVIKATSGDDATELKSLVELGKMLASGGLEASQGEMEGAMGPDMANKIATALKQVLSSIQPEVDGDELKLSVTAPEGTDELIQDLGKLLEEQRQKMKAMREMFENRSKEFESDGDFDDAGFKDFDSDGSFDSGPGEPADLPAKDS